MKLKDLFKSTKTLASASLDDIASELESQEYVESFNKDKIRFLPNVDYSEPKNFAFFGSAEKYYTDAFVRIKGNYPYDGSEKEKFDWQNDSTFLDMYIFEHRYPRFNGYVDMGYPAWGTLQGSTIDGYGKSNTNTFIKTFGGPNQSYKTGLLKQFDDANKYATASLDSTASVTAGTFRESNLNYNLSGGVTIEMWLKKPSFDTAKTQKEVLFDLWNGEVSSSDQYGRFRLELTGASSGSPFLLTALSGTGATQKGAQNQSLGTNLTTASITDWTHVALSLKNSGSDIQTNLYINGALNQRQTISNAAMNPVTGTLISYIGALQTAPSGSPTIVEGAGKFSGSLDEFRFWKTERTSKEVGRNYWTHIGAGTNTDKANSDLGIYYKFNEGITTNVTVDATVLDYSGRVSNGAWTGYQEGARNTGSAIVLSNAAPKEFKDPTIYSSHPDYISILTELEASGSIHDIENNSSLFNGMPSWILEEDDTKEGNLRNLTQVMGSFFDNMYLYIQESNSIKDVYAHFQTKILEEQEYENVKTTNITGSVKPLPFADRLLTNAGFVAPELFADATIIEALASRAEDENYEMKIHDVKNQIYQNVYSVLTDIYKSKGSKKSFRNVLHAFGIDEDVVKINMYADNLDFEIGDKHNIRARKEKFIDFNHPDRFNGSIYQYASGSNGASFISGSESDFDKYIPITFETQVILPNKLPWNSSYGFETPFTKSVIAGMHRANPADGTDFAVPSPDYGEIQLYSVRDEKESKRVRFHLSSSALGVHLSSSLYDDQYLNNEWLFAFRLKNDRYPTTDLILSSSLNSDYTIDFVGYNTEANTVLESFEFSSPVTRTRAHNFLSYSKRIYAGSHYENFTGNLQDRSDHKIGFVRYWLNDLSNDVLLKHANDSANYGAESPFKSAYLMENGINDIKVPEIDTLLLHWDFEILSTSNASGSFIATDVTSGSGEQRYVAAFESIKRKFYHGKGDFFLANDQKVVDVEYINSSRITAPELLSGDDMIEIRTQDDLKFTRNTLPQDYFIAFEKSMSQTISEEMINFMSSITAFNDLIGRPVDRYRMDYKDLSKLRQLFFERITGELDLDKYIDYYKWLDDALGEMLVALVPASIKHSDGVNNVIENHIFSRDKYMNKYPTIEFMAPEPEGCMKTINRHLYPWKTGHAPNPLQENDNCFWWLNRAERTATGTAGIQPSDLPTNSIHVTAEGDVLYNFSEPVSRVQIDLIGLEYAGVSQTNTATAAWSPAYTVQVLGVKRLILFQSGGLSDFSNNIPAGSGILIKLADITRMPTGDFGTDPTNSNFFRNSNATGRLTITYASLENLGSSTPSVNDAAGVLNTRQKVFQARNSQLRRSWCTAQHFAVDRQRHLHGGINYEDNKRRGYVWSATKTAGESPIDYGEFGGFPLRYILVNNDMFVALNDCNDERPVTEKIKRAFGAYDGFDVFHHYLSGSDDGVKKGAMVVPFNIMSSSVKTGYTDKIEGLPGGQSDINIVNLHSDTVDNTNAIPLQSPFTERWVGGHQSRHAPINQGSDTTGSRGEGYKILLNKIQNESGSIGIVSPDYPDPHSNRNTTPHMYIKQAKARYFREERAKRPVNIRNIQTSGSQVGNYQKNYQFVHTFGRSIQKSILRDLASDAQLHNATNADLPQTTQEASLIARGVTGNGNVASNFNTSSLYLRDVKTSKAAYADHEASSSGDSIIVNRFSAPGGFETMSEIFLDLYSKEKSSYNALPFRNLQVRKASSGEAGTIRLVDIHGNRYGLLTHQTRHSAQFGIDSVLGGSSASYHKVNRNSKWDTSEQSYDHDNWWIQHQIPQSDFQYKWVKSSHTASYATSSLSGHVLSEFTEPSGTTSRYAIEHINNVVTNQSSMNINRAGAPTLLSSTMDQTPYGYPSWEQIRNNDKNINVQTKKAYGFRYSRTDNLAVNNAEISGSTLTTDQTVDESRVTENIPNTIDLNYRGSNFEFKYPYVNMRYHFDNKALSKPNVGQLARIPNETMYESLYGYYSKHETNNDLSVVAVNFKQIVFPQYVKHTKFFVRHRHFFASHFWTDGENDLYQTDINETGSYFKVDEVGRRETSVTAAFWPTENLTEQTIGLIDDGLLTNIIPSQSIWSMDSRTYFDGTNAPAGVTGLASTGWDHHIAASNSIGAPGVLQNQDHHFHNDVSHLRLIQSGSAASGTFKLRGATRFGTAASGAFTVYGVIPAGIPASGSFEVSSAFNGGTAGVGTFTSVGVYQNTVNSTYAFTAVGRTQLGTHASASFRASGSQYLGSPTIGNYTFNQGAYAPGNASTGSFTVSDTRQFVSATQATTNFQVKPAIHPPVMPEATFQIDSIHFPGTQTTSTFTLDNFDDSGWGNNNPLIFRLHLGGATNTYNTAPTTEYPQSGAPAENHYVEIQIGNNVANNVPSKATIDGLPSSNTNNYQGVIKIKPNHPDFSNNGNFSNADTNVNFLNHVRDLLKLLQFAGNRGFDCSRSGNNFTLSTTTGVHGRGTQHFFVENSDPGNCSTSPSTTGGQAHHGVQNSQHIRIPYWNTSANSFRTASFEVDTETGNTPTVASLNGDAGIPLPGLSSSAQIWQSTYTITDDTSYFNAIKGTLKNVSANSFSSNYDIDYTTSGVHPNQKATFKLKLKSSIVNTAHAAVASINSSSWDSSELTGGENKLANTNFGTFVASCGSTEDDAIRILIDGSIKTFKVGDGSSGVDGNIITIDGSGVNNTTWYNNFETAINGQLPSGFTVSKVHNAGNASNVCDDTGVFTITNTNAGAYGFSTSISTNVGTTFSNVINSNGAAAFGFGSISPSTLSLAGTVVAQAATDNTAINVSKNQTQSAIINNIILSIQGNTPGTNYNVTSHPDGNSCEFRMTASAAGTVNNRTMAGVGQFAEDGNLAGGSADSGLGANTPVELRIRKGTDYASSWTSSDTAESVLIQIGTSGTTTATAGSYSTNPVIINVTDGGLNSDSALYTKIAQAVENHSSISIVNSDVHNTNQLSLTSSAIGGGNTNFYTNTGGAQLSRASATGGNSISGSVNGHTLTLGTKSIILDNSSPYSNSGNNVYVRIDGINDSTMWADMESQINSETEFTVDSTSDNAGIRTFNLKADITGSAKNSLTVATSDASFNVIQTPAAANTGTNETGAADGNKLIWFAHQGQNAHGYELVVDKDNSNTNGLNVSSSVNLGNGFTSIYVDSTRNSDSDYWNAIRDGIAAEGSGSGDNPSFSVSYTTGGSPTSASFIITNYITGAAGNGGGSGNGNVFGSSFTRIAPSKFTGGSDPAGAAIDDTITIHGQDITVTHGTADHANLIVDGSGSSLTNDQYWEAIRTVINANIADVTATRVNGAFTVSTTATGSSQNPAISDETGNTFTITNAGTSGTTESGAENGDTITIDGQTFTINTSSGLGTGSNSQFHNALTKSIKDNTDFDTVSVDSEAGGFFKFNLTSSVIGTAKNVTFTQNTNGIRTTFRNLIGAAGGTSPIGIGDLDAIKITNAGSTVKTFTVDTAGDGAGSSEASPIYIDISSLTGTDPEKSVKFWNALSASLKTHTDYDTITITPDGNIATFAITSSITGTAYNGNITSVYDPNGDGIGFTETVETAGGTNEQGSTTGNTLAISNSSGQTTFTIVNSAPSNTREILAGTIGSPITDTQFFNNVTASIIANTDYDLITYAEASDTGSFSITSSNGTSDPFTGQNYLTGVAYNGAMTTTGNSFHTTTGPSGGVDGIFSDVKYLEIIPQPRYNYPHALTSPGSLRCPTDKSNLGLIHQIQAQSGRYRLRSNHFALTRSLGYHTDGLYDNTSRFDTPDLSGLVPFDDHYDEYYERFRGHNKHHALVPEFRMSTHVKDIITQGADELQYFQKNYWLELTGTSLDDGASVSTNKDTALNLRTFNDEFTVTSKIKNMEKFISDNVNNQVGLLPYTLTLTCEAIKQFLPYEGFYPQTRTVQMAEAFANSYAKKIESREADPADTVLSFPDNNPLAQARPVFDAMTSPGLLYNTIKSGIAVDYPIITSKMGTASVKDPYGGTNYMVANEYFEDRLPFETLLNPERFMNKKYIVDLHPHPSSSFNLKARIGGKINSNYQLMAQNFFAESMEFFLDRKQTSKIISKPDTDPSFGIVLARQDGALPVYRGIFKVYKSKKQHPYLELSGANDIVLLSNNPSGVMDLIHNRPPSGTNYFLDEYAGLTGTDLEYDIEETNYPRPNMNPFTEVGTITMYSQPNAFGPPCAGGVAVQFSSIDGAGAVQTGDDNNTSYMMYDSTNGYNAPYTPPYYDGEAWAIYTFKPNRTGKHSLNEILEKTNVEYLRYEVNHESGAYGDRGTFGPQGFTLNENAMQVDASFNLFKKALVMPPENAQAVATIVEGDSQPGGAGGAIRQPLTRGTCWVIESKYETPILDFSKYLNREYNAEFESDVTDADIHTASLSLSGTRQEPDILSAVHPKLASVHKLSGVLNPIGMWHQYGEHPAAANKGIFMQMTDVPPEYTRLGTEMTCPNPKYAVVKPEVSSCDGAGLVSSYTTNVRTTIAPYVKKQVNKRRLLGDSQFSVMGGAIQVVDAETDIILDAELRYAELQSIFGYTLNDISTVAENFKFFNVFRDTTLYNKSILTSNADFINSSQQLSVYDNNTASSDYNAGSTMGAKFKGNFATSYYNYDRHTTYAPLMIVTKDYNSLSYDYGEFGSGFFEDFLKDFSIGIPYSKQSTRYEDAEPVDCVPSNKAGGGTILAPTIVARFIDATNKTLTVGSLSKIDLSQGGIVEVLSAKNIIGTTSQATTTLTPEAILVNSSITTGRKIKKSFSTIRSSRKLFKLIPPCPIPAALQASDTATYSYPEPQFVRASVRYNAGAPIAGALATQLGRNHLRTMPQAAPQNDNNITAGASTIRWGQFMHSRGDVGQVRSLAELVGFDTNPVKMGVTAKSQIISEAVVAIPYIALEGTQPRFVQLDYHEVNKWMLQNGVISEDRSPLEAGEIELNAAIINQINQMQRYVFPPHIDFINYDVNPMPMYIFEFMENLERDDLTSIWQGVLPETLKIPTFDTKSVSHVLSPESFLGKEKQAFPDMSVLKDIKWRVFKVKKKAKKNYDAKMAKDLISQGLLASPEQITAKNLGNVGYNWPYDYCSIVEEAQISVDIQLIQPNDPPPIVGVGNSDIVPDGGISILGEPVQFNSQDSTSGAPASVERSSVLTTATNLVSPSGLAEIVYGTDDDDPPPTNTPDIPPATGTPPRNTDNDSGDGGGYGGGGGGGNYDVG